MEDRRWKPIPEQKEKTGGNETRNIGIDFKKHENPVNKEHSDHEQGAVSKVDNLSYAKNKTQAHGYEAVKSAHQNTVDRCFNETNHVSTTS